MAIALPLVVHLFSPLQAAVNWLAGGPSSENLAPVPAEDDAPHPFRSGAPAEAPRPANDDRPQKAWRGPIRAPQPLRRGTTETARPVRVIRVCEDRSRPRAQAGRMVISGRLADVCAELDRLVALDGRS
ncbi:hypothetical protein [Ramlibacter rhizophilus]|uniref:Uncharacterized protein n=1 Tax=Ramlibacter rhizophilus TaxID=1781167 RepID=A0A4Z0C3H7_9BURK|nr:hypothetical protein [Ramlibacter rhizophilus]TFZ04759.1 hypothetical protein EZ242_03140 [Ramlibacter rhizophilus]